MAEQILSVRALCKSYGALRVTDCLSFDVAEGECHALIGPNGAGKTTLIGQLFGEIESDSGEIVFRGRSIRRLPRERRVELGMARAFQITSVFPEFNALENVALAVRSTQGHSFRFWQRADRDSRAAEAASSILMRVGLEHRMGVIAGDMAHGEHRQLEVAMALALKPRLLLLDEPMAGMSSDESRTMTDLLLSLKGQLTMLLVEHDMDTVFRLADRLTVLVAGSVLASGYPDAIRANEHVRRAYLGDNHLVAA